MSLEDGLEQVLDLLSVAEGVRPVSYGLGTQYPEGQTEGTWHIVFSVRVQAGWQFLQRLSLMLARNRQVRCVLVEGDLLRPEPYLLFCLESITPVDPATVVTALDAG